MLLSHIWIVTLLSKHCLRSAIWRASLPFFKPSSHPTTSRCGTWNSVYKGSPGYPWVTANMMLMAYWSPSRKQSLSCQHTLFVKPLHPEKTSLLLDNFAKRNRELYVCGCLSMLHQLISSHATVWKIIFSRSAPSPSVQRGSGSNGMMILKPCRALCFLENRWWSNSRKMGS